MQVTQEGRKEREGAPDRGSRASARGRARPGRWARGRTGARRARAILGQPRGRALGSRTAAGNSLSRQGKNFLRILDYSQGIRVYCRQIAKRREGQKMAKTLTIVTQTHPVLGRPLSEAEVEKVQKAAGKAA